MAVRKLRRSLLRLHGGDPVDSGVAMVGRGGIAARPLLETRASSDADRNDQRPHAQGGSLAGPSAVEACQRLS